MVAPNTAAVSVGTPEVVELRCPVGPRKLFAKMRVSGSTARVTSDNLIEMSCPDCRRSMQRSGRSVSHVLHRFNIIGDLVETVVER